MQATTECDPRELLGMHDGVPVLPAYRDDDQLCVWCEVERRWHCHSAFDGPVTAHCERHRRKHASYILREVGSLTDDVKRLARSRN